MSGHLQVRDVPLEHTTGLNSPLVLTLAVRVIFILQISVAHVSQARFEVQLR